LQLFEGEIQTATEIRNRLRDRLTQWFTNQTPDRIIYDRTWKGLVSSNGIANQGADFGLGWYNDHRTSSFLNGKESLQN
jgi:endoglucanase Acf2